MNTARRNWMKRPTRNEMLLVCTVWLVSVVLMVSAATNMFNENLFQRPDMMLGSLNFATTVITLATVVNYFRNRRKAA